MSRFYRRTKPGLKDNLEAGILAAGLAAGVAAVSFYFVRLFRSREPLEPVEPARQLETPPSPDTAKSLPSADEDRG